MLLKHFYYNFVEMSENQNYINMRKVNFFIPLIALIIISSCTKKDIELNDDDSQKLAYNSKMTKEIISAQNTFDLSNSLIENSYKDILKSGFGFRDFDCAEISKTNSFGHFPNTFTIDFGEGCDVNDSLNISGKMILTFSGWFNHSGDSIVFHYENFYVNGKHIEGEFVKKNLGKDQNGNRTFSKQIRNAKVTFENGDVSSFNSLRYSKYYRNNTPFDFEDDELGFTGNFDGITSDGDTYDGIIRNELILPLSCGCVVSGELEITYNSTDVYTLDYGDGDCDKVGTLHYPDGTVEEIEICK